MEANKKTVLKVRFKSTQDRLKFWNGPLELSKKELEVLAYLIDSKGDLCSTENRSQACAALGMTKAVINTYIKRLKTRKALIYDKGEYLLAPIFKLDGIVEINMLGRS